jgi:hypothetical protein
MQTVPEWDQKDPETVGQLVSWFLVAEDHLDEPNMKDYVAGRWAYLVDKVATEQGVTAGWLSYMITSLVVDERSGQQA